MDGECLCGPYTGGIVNVNKAVTLKGANFGVSCSGTRGTESTINGGAGTAVTIASNGVTIDGFTINGAFGISDASYVGLSVSNNIINATATA